MISSLYFTPNRSSSSPLDVVQNVFGQISFPSFHFQHFPLVNFLANRIQLPFSQNPMIQSINFPISPPTIFLHSFIRILCPSPPSIPLFPALQIPFMTNCPWLPPILPLPSHLLPPFWHISPIPICVSAPIFPVHSHSTPLDGFGPPPN
jgi:hypothetical protein